MNIGVFDSGLGGLWVLKHLRETLPDYDYIFLADQNNVPFGNKTKDELFLIATKALDYLYGEMNCNGVILACNTISSTIYDQLREWKDEHYFGKILFGIVHPTIESMNKNDKVVVFATPRTCESDVYDRFLKTNVGSYIKIPLPNLAYSIENEGDTYSYLSSFKDKVSNEINKGALLCTHYGVVKDDFKKVFPFISEWVCQEDLIPNYIKNYFIEFPERESFFSHNKSLSIYVTKKNDIFSKFLEKWFNQDIKINFINL